MKTATNKPILIEISQIKNQFDVRRALNDDRILTLAELIDGGTELPPIEVTELAGADKDKDGFKYAFVDGRHRAAAYGMLDKTEILAKIVERHDLPTMFSRALLANWGGALPPTSADIQHTVRRMLEAGASNAAVRKHLQFLPESTVRKCLHDAQQTIKKVRLRQALEAVANGLRPHEAAERFGIDVEDVTTAISGKKRKFGSGDSGIEADGKLYIKRAMKSTNNGIAKKLDVLYKYVDAAEVQSKTVEKVLDEWEAQLVRTLGRLRDWRQRLEAIAAGRELPPEPTT